MNRRRSMLFASGMIEVAQLVVIKSSGIYIVPANTVKLDVFLVGAGGGGGLPVASTSYGSYTAGYAGEGGAVVYQENMPFIKGEEINVVVPTGNFGNILASHYAKEMGLPIHKFICASNENKVLTDFFQTGTYDKRRELVLTESPSMDILVSSNLERLLFEACGRNGEEVKNLMESLNNGGVYKVSEKISSFMNEFYGNYANIDEVYAEIKEMYTKEGYLMDTHTGVAKVVYDKYKKETGDDRKVLIASTASPYKFPRSICKALGINVDNLNDFEVVKELNKETHVEIPKNLKDLDKKEVLHNEVWDKDDMKKALLSYLK